MKTERRLNREQIVGFQADGHQLWGTVYLPGCRDPEAPVVILSWTVTQLYVAVARALSDAGFCVLRFDPHGKGDSGGDLFFPTLHHLWYATERGFFLTDFRAAVDYAECEMGARSVVFAGICGDAITAILEGVEDPRVAGIVLLELPMLFSQGTGTVQRMMDFRRALLDRNRLLTAFVNVVDFGWYAAQRCRNFYTDHILRLAHLFKSNGPRIDWTSTALGITANTKMLDALVNVFERQIPTLCIFAPKRNRLLFESILPCLRERFPGLDKTMEYRVIPEADHVFSMPNHMQQVCTFFLNWMRDSRRPWASAIVSTESSAIVEAQATGTAYPGTVSQGDSSDQAISIETSEG